MYIVGGVLLGILITIVGAYIHYLRGRANSIFNENQALRDMIKLFTERQIIAALDETQLKFIIGEVSQVTSQAVIAAVQSLDPERLD
jgi:hypothetical protein